MRRVLQVLVLFFIFGRIQPVCAEDGEAGVKAHQLEPVTVSAKKQRYRFPGLENEPVYSQYATTESAKISTEIIDSEEIEDINPIDFYDLISRAAGVQESFQGRKVMNFVSIRRGSGMGILIDGYYIPPNQASRVLAQFPMDAVESIRVVRDSTSLTLGPLKAFASFQSAPNEGFILITTKKGYRPEVGMVAEYGTLDTRELQLYHGNRIANFNYRLTGTATGTGGRSGWYNDSNSLSVLFDGGYDGPKLKVNTMVFFSKGKRNMQIANNVSPTSTNIPHWGYDPLESLWIAFTANMLWTSNQITSFSYNHGLVEDTEWTSSYNGVTGKLNPKSSEQRDSADNYHLWHTAVFGNDTVKTGAQVTWWHEPTGYASYDGKEREETLVGGYLQDEHRFLGGRLTVDVGARVDCTYIKKGVDKYSPTQATNKVIENDWTKPVYGGSIGSAYFLNDIYAFTARFGFSHAALDSFLATVNDKELPAEERFKYEAGFAAKFHPAFNPNLTLFYYDIKNAKQSVDSVTVSSEYSYNIYDSYNEGLYGGELNIGGVVPYGFNYKVNYTHNESTVDSNNSGKPKDSLSFLVGHTYGPIKTNVSLRYVAPYTSGADTFGNLVNLDGNVSYIYRIKKLQGRIMFYARNILNDRYITQKNYSDVGFTFGGRLEAAF
jgi:hypothetical protein